MTALAAAKQLVKYNGSPLPAMIPYAQKTGTTIYPGALVSIASDGYCRPARASTTDVVVGYARKNPCSQSGNYTSTVAGDSMVEVSAGVIKLANSAASDEITITELWGYAYAVDDQTVAKTDGSTTRVRAGRIVGLDAGGVYVLVGLGMTAIDGVTLTGTENLTNKTLTTPTIAATGFTNANHAHAAANSGGQLDGSACFSTAVSVANGGTNLSSYAIGDIIYASGATALSKLVIGTANQVLTVNAGATAPEWANMLDPDLKGTIEIALGDIYDADGDRAKFANGGADGVTIADSKAVCYRINNDAAPPKNLCGFVVPADADVTANMTLKFECSKSGNTDADDTTITVEAFNQVSGALHDADDDYGGTTNALVGNAAAKTLTTLSLTLALANLPAVGSGVSLTFKPTDGTLGTDDLLIHRMWVEYTKKLDA
jgi:hypothetical protein